MEKKTSKLFSKQQKPFSIIKTFCHFIREITEPTLANINY